MAFTLDTTVGELLDNPQAKAVLDKVGERTNTTTTLTTTLLKGAFRSRTRSVRRIAQQLHRVARGKGEEAVEQLKAAYAKLLDIAQATAKQANQVHDALVDTYAYVFIETNLTGQATKGARHLIGTLSAPYQSHHRGVGSLSAPG